MFFSPFTVQASESLAQLFQIESKIGMDYEGKSSIIGVKCSINRNVATFENKM